MKKCLAAALLILAGLTGCGDSAAAEIPELLEPVNVKLDVAQAQMGEIYQIYAFNGAIVPYVEELSFQVDGTLEELTVTLGEMVTEGAVLAVLSEEQLLNQTKALEEEITNITRMGEFSDRQVNADIGIAREELAILKETGASDKTCSVKELEIQKLELSLLQDRELRELNLKEKQRSLEALEEKLGKNQITAPFNGRIVYVDQIKAGDNIQGYTPVIYIADESRLSLSTAYISESTIENADKIYAKIMDREYEITYVPYDKDEYVQMLLSGEEMKSHFLVEAEEGALKSSQFAAVILQRSYKENVLTIPYNALYRDESGRYVYKLVDGQRVKCNVTVGITTDVKAEILEGLVEGDMVYVKE